MMLRACLNEDGRGGSGGREREGEAVQRLLQQLTTLDKRWCQR